MSLIWCLTCQCSQEGAWIASLLTVFHLLELVFPILVSSRFDPSPDPPIHLSKLADNPAPPSSHFPMLFHRRACRGRRLPDGNLRSVGGEADGRRLRMKGPSRRRSRCLLSFFSYASTLKLAPVRVLENAVQSKGQQKIVSMCRLQRDRSRCLESAEYLCRVICDSRGLKICFIH